MATMVTSKLALMMLKTMVMVMVLTIQVNHNGDNNNYDDYPITMINYYQQVALANAPCRQVSCHSTVAAL